MVTNHYFNHFPKVKIGEQLLYEDLLVESIRIMGHNIYYIPRENWDDTDTLFGENISSKFERAYSMEMYIANVEGFEGEGDFFSKFGYEMRETSNFIVATRTFEKYVPSTITRRPREGDLIYVPILERIFELKFVEEELMFFAKGNRTPYIYELRGEVFRYANEVIDTGIDIIDQIDADTSYAIEMVVSGTGDFNVGEIVYQGSDYANATMTATVASWDPSNTQLEVININGTISANSNLTGVTSNTTYNVVIIDTMGDYVEYDLFDNKLIQDEANVFLDFSETNPFGIPVWVTFLINSSIGLSLMELAYRGAEIWNYIFMV